MRITKAISSKRLRVALAVAALAAAAILPILIVQASPGEVAGPTIEAPCWVSIPKLGPSGLFEVIVGSQRGKLTPTGAPEAFADAFFDNDAGDCGYADWAGKDIDDDFLIRVESAIAIDDAVSSSGFVRFYFYIRKFTGQRNCSGTPGAWTAAPLQTVSFGSSVRYDWREIDPWGVYSFVAIPPAWETDDSYQYALRTYTSVTGGGATLTPWKFGCFNVNGPP